MEDKLGKIIQTFREAAGLTQDELGSSIGVSQQTIAKWEGGKSKPRPRALSNLISVLKIDGRKLRDMQASSTIDTFKYLGEDALAEMMLDDPEITNWEAANAALPASGSLQTTFPAEARFDYSANSAALKRLIMPVVQEAEPSSQWDQMVRAQYGTWRMDYMNDELYAQILHAPSPAVLGMHLRVNIYKYLWQYLSLGVHGTIFEKSSRYQLVILTLPENQPVNEQFPGQPSARTPVSNELMLKRITTEASVKGIYVVLARTPEQVVSFLTNPLRIYDTGWNFSLPEEPVPYE